MLQQQQVTDVANTIGNTQEQWLNNVELIARHFNLIEWWNGQGKNQFPLMYPVAMCILSLPDSNGHQERTFSAATWMDGKLNAMQKDMTFQMKVLLYKNANFLQRYSGKIQESSLEDAEQKTKELLKQHIASKQDADIGTDEESLMDLYHLSELE